MRELLIVCTLASITLLSVTATAPVAAHPAGEDRALGQRILTATESPTARAAAVPPPTPRADCGPGSRPETAIQGRVPAGSKGFACNIALVGRQGNAGGYKVHRFTDKAGRDCAYYDTTLLFPSNAQTLSEQPTGVAVVDMSNPAKPVQTASLSTPAMQSPHESLVLNERRGLLAAVLGNPTFYPGVVDIYDLNEDCRRPALRSSLPVGVLGHESGFAPDGNTFYATSLATGQVTAVDVSDPSAPKPLGVAQYRSHGLTVSEDGNRAYVAADTGLIIVDVSDIQARRPNPQFREISRLSWDTLTIPQVAIPVTIRGRPYLVEIDEFSGTDSSTGPAANGSRVGAGRIIDIADERAPKVVSNIRLAVHQPENRAALADDPGADSSLQGYAGHYCAVPRRTEPGIVACSFIASGLRVFDIRDPAAPKEIAYFTTPGEASNYAMSGPAFVPDRGEIWYSDGNSGFYAVRVTNGVWPVGRGADRAGGCLARRSPVGPANIGRVRLGLKRPQALSRIKPQPVRRSSRVDRWCVKRSSGRVSAVFSSRSARGRARLVKSTAADHRFRGIRRGVTVRRLRARFPSARRVSGGVYRARPRSRRIFGTRAGRVRFVGVADRRLMADRKRLRRFLRLAR